MKRTAIEYADGGSVRSTGWWVDPPVPYADAHGNLCGVTNHVEVHLYAVDSEGLTYHLCASGGSYPVITANISGRDPILRDASAAQLETHVLKKMGIQVLPGWFNPVWGHKKL